MATPSPAAKPSLNNIVMNMLHRSELPGSSGDRYFSKDFTFLAVFYF